MLAELDAIEPGLVLAAFLARIDVERCSDYDRVVVLRAHQRMVAHHQAEAMAAMVALADTMDGMFSDDPVLAYEAASTEIRAALCLTRRAADTQLGLAVDVKERLPRVWEMLRGGEVDVPRARVLVEGVAHLGVETAREVVERVAGEVSRLTTGQLRARLQRLCIDTDPGEAKTRFEASVSERRVVVEVSVDGTAHLSGMDLAPERVMAVSERINRLARRLRGGGETRSMDQLRADVFLDLLEGRGTHRSGRGVVEIRVDAVTLAGLAESPAELGGYGPVIADIARRVAADNTDAEWRYVLTDPVSGEITATGITRRRPSAAQRRLIEARYPTCLFPGCRMPARQCDLDHRIPWAQGGPTLCRYLGPGCRHDHVTVRHRIGWTYRRLPNGDHQWTSPLGHTYTTSGTPP